MTSSFLTSLPITWFPGHMVQSIHLVKSLIPKLNAVIEIRDSRVAFSSRNPLLESLTHHLPRCIILNKSDLIPSKDLDIIEKCLIQPYEWMKSLPQPVPSIYWDSQLASSLELSFAPTKSRIKRLQKQTKFQKEYPNLPPPPSIPPWRICPFPNSTQPKVIHTNALTKLNLKKILQFLQETSKNNMPVNALVCGIPNVGKSSLINGLRKINHLPGNVIIGAKPGVTRKVTNYQISSKPFQCTVFDSPGINIPSKFTQTSHVGLNLALTQAFPEHIVSLRVQSEYLLYRLNTFAGISNTEFMTGSLFSHSEADEKIFHQLSTVEKLVTSSMVSNFDLPMPCDGTNRPLYMDIWPSIQTPVVTLDTLLEYIDPIPERAMQKFLKEFQIGSFSQLGSLDILPTNIDSVKSQFFSIYSTIQ